MLITNKMMKFKNEEEKKEFYLYVKKCREQKIFADCDLGDYSCPRTDKFSPCFVFCSTEHNLYEELDF